MDESKTKKSNTGNAELHCSFCAKSQNDLEVLVAGPGVFICNECAEMANMYISNYQNESEDDENSKARKTEELLLSILESKQTAELLEGLVNVERTRKSIDSHQQTLADLLRSRRIRWVEIGNALGVTRQAAWQRFGAAD